MMGPLRSFAPDLSDQHLNNSTGLVNFNGVVLLRARTFE